MICYLTDNWRWPLGCLLFLVTACNSPGVSILSNSSKDSAALKQLVTRAFNSIDSITRIIKPGDLIARTGNDFTSESLRSLNQRDKTYSHCGIASIEDKKVFVYHALGGEFNPNQKIKRETLKEFAEPYSNRGIGIYRFNIPRADIDNCLQIAKQWYKEGIMFDMEFDLQTNDRMYCAEFIYKTYMQGTNKSLQFNVSSIKDFKFIGVDDLFLHPLCFIQKKVLYR